MQQKSDKTFGWNSPENRKTKKKIDLIGSAW